MAALGLTFTRREALGAGYRPADVERLLRSGRWRRLGRGSYADAAVLDTLPRALRHQAELAAILRRYPPTAAASHASAGLLLGLPVRFPELAEITVPGARCRRGHGVVVHGTSLPRHRVSTVGVPVTSPARTVVDLARTLLFIDGVAVVVAVVDAALHIGLVRLEELVPVLIECSTWPGMRRAHRVLRFADGRAETPLESWSRVAIAKAGSRRRSCRRSYVTARGRSWAGSTSCGGSAGRSARPMDAESTPMTAGPCGTRSDERIACASSGSKWFGGRRRTCPPLSAWESGYAPPARARSGGRGQRMDQPHPLPPARYPAYRGSGARRSG